MYESVDGQRASLSQRVFICSKLGIPMTGMLPNDNAGDDEKRPRPIRQSIDMSASCACAGQV